MSVDIYVYLFDSQAYEEILLPAYRSFVQRNDNKSLVRLLKNTIPKLESLAAGYGEPGWSTKSYEANIAILDGTRYYSSQAKEPEEGNVTTSEDLRILVDEFVGPDLLRALCLPRNLGVNPQQNMSSKALVEYLYSQSRWIEDYFTGSKQVTGMIPEIKLGESCRFFSRYEVETFDRELSRLERPADPQVLADGFDNLRTLVHTAGSQSSLKLLYVYI